MPTHDYKRNGTTTLFAALDILKGEVIGQCMDVRRIIIGDAVNVQLLRRCPVNSFEEFEELLMTVPRPIRAWR